MKITNKWAKQVVKFQKAGKSMDSVIKWWGRNTLSEAVVKGDAVEFLFPESVPFSRGGYRFTGRSITVLVMPVW